jgi:NAD(P)-dependent dehydrogenase (short-subunit alcohol dehydrogenase family)
MSSKTILITGATNGIGYHAAVALARMGHALILHGRDPKKGAAVVAAIRREVGGADLRFMQADFASLTDVRRLAAEVNALPRLDVLINNAGSLFLQRSQTSDGFEMTFGVNHLAPFLLTNLLLDKLKAAGAARIVNVASNAHRRGGPINFSDLMSTRSYAGFKVYGRSKLANVLHTRSLSQRLVGTGVTTNCLHPGVVRTGFGHNSGLAMRIALKIAGRIFMISPEEGALTTVYLATAPEVEGVSGLYFARCRPAQLAQFAEDAQAAERLWAESEELVGLRGQ